VIVRDQQSDQPNSGQEGAGGEDDVQTAKKPQAADTPGLEPQRFPHHQVVDVRPGRNRAETGGQRGILDRYSRRAEDALAQLQVIILVGRHAGLDGDRVKDHLEEKPRQNRSRADAEENAGALIWIRYLHDTQRLFRRLGAGGSWCQVRKTRSPFAGFPFT
jgi:hypothetical protein